MLKIVLADDNVRAADGLARAIDYPALGYVCCGVAYNGRQALDLALRYRANVVITDVRMPIMDGLELSRRLREALPGVSIIILSAHDDFEYARSALATGVEDYVLKPLDKAKVQGIADILRRVHAKVGRRATVLARITGERTREELCECLDRSDPDLTLCRIGEVLSVCEADFPCALEAGSRVLSLLHDHAARSVRPPPGALERKLAELGGETSVEGITRYVTAAALSLGQAMAQARREAKGGVIAAITAHIDANCHDPALTVRAILARFHVSASYLHQVFRAHNGTTPNAYITQRRLERARALLESGQATVAQAARDAGYRDPHYFARVFRKRYGLPPAEHRRLSLGRSGP